MAKRPRDGDVLEIEASSGWIYAQFLGTHPLYGDAIRVSPEVHPARRVPDADLFRSGYVTFYPARAAIAQGLTRVVGNLDSPGLPPRMRRRGTMTGSRVDTWIVDGENGKELVVRGRLSESQRRLSIASVWNHEALITAVHKGWTPEMEAGSDESPRADEIMPPAGPPTDADALEALFQVSKPGSLHRVEHFLYFGNESNADRAVRELEAQGFTVEKTPEAIGGSSWLVLAVQSVVPTDEGLTKVRKDLTGLASKLGGFYDGWQAAVNH